MTEKQKKRRRDLRKLKAAGFIALRYYGNSGPYAYKLPGKTKWMTRQEALQTLEKQP